MKNTFFSLLFCAYFLLNCAFTTQKTKNPTGDVSPLKQVSVSDAPSNFKFKGKVSEVYTFSDNEGEHLIVVAETGEFKSVGKDKSNDMKDTEMYVHHFLQKNGTYTEVWKAQDYIRDCEFDLILNIRPESMEVTDLDKDGIGEISFVYVLACISDVSPYDMKLLMYEGMTKYALRGTAKVMEIESKYTLDAAFKAAPKAFLEFAKKKWASFEDQMAG
jgi:hypothetical protein